jgi:DNA primase
VFPHYEDPLLVESGMVILQTEEDTDEKRYDRFRDRIMFPIRNIKGECIGFGGRVLGDEKPKYLNSPETPVFSKGRELYGLYEARPALRDTGYALVTEGYMDVVALAQLGFPNAVATLGTACTPDHIRKLFRFTDTVVFSFDGDGAGRRAARKALEAALPFATDERSVKFLFLPAEHDPDSFIRTLGQEAFAREVNDAVPLSRFLIEAAKDGCDMGSAEGRALLASRAKPLWLQLPDGALKRQLLGDIADLVQLAGRELTELWTPATARQRSATTKSYQKDSDKPMSHKGQRPFQPKYSAGSAGGRARGRALPASRADHAVRLLMTDLAAMQALSAEEHAMLCELPPPHGTLFVWLEGQLQEHGTQPWAALREALRGTDLEALADRLMDQDALGSPDDAGETHDELRRLLDRMLIERLKSKETEMIQAAQSDPTALLRYRDLQLRRRQLEAAVEPVERP